MYPDSEDANTQEQTAPAGFEAIAVGPSLTVASLDTSMAWYRDVLGFAVERTYEREGKLMAVALRAGSVEMLLTQDNGAKGSDRVKGEGFSLMFTSLQDIDALAAGAKARGATLDAEPADAFGMRVFRLRDPDGFKLAIASQRPA
ncbi:MAG: VOC family protein [Gemmatimonadota bacterium]